MFQKDGVAFAHAIILPTILADIKAAELPKGEGFSWNKNRVEDAKIVTALENVIAEYVLSGMPVGGVYLLCVLCGMCPWHLSDILVCCFRSIRRCWYCRHPVCRWFGNFFGRGQGDEETVDHHGLQSTKRLAHRRSSTGRVLF